MAEQHKIHVKVLGPKGYCVDPLFEIATSRALFLKKILNISEEAEEIEFTMGEVGIDMESNTFDFVNRICMVFQLSICLHNSEGMDKTVRWNRCSATGVHMEELSSHISFKISVPRKRLTTLDHVIQTCKGYRTAGRRIGDEYDMSIESLRKAAKDILKNPMVPITDDPVTFLTVLSADNCVRIKIPQMNLSFGSCEETVLIGVIKSHRLIFEVLTEPCWCINLNKIVKGKWENRNCKKVTCLRCLDENHTLKDIVDYCKEHELNIYAEDMIQNAKDPKAQKYIRSLFTYPALKEMGLDFYMKRSIHWVDGKSLLDHSAMDHAWNPPRCSYEKGETLRLARSMKKHVHLQGENCCQRKIQCIMIDESIEATKPVGPGHAVRDCGGETVTESQGPTERSDPSESEESEMGGEEGSSGSSEVESYTSEESSKESEESNTMSKDDQNHEGTDKTRNHLEGQENENNEGDAGGQNQQQEQDILLRKRKNDGDETKAIDEDEGRVMEGLKKRLNQMLVNKDSVEYKQKFIYKFRIDAENPRESVRKLIELQETKRVYLENGSVDLSDIDYLDVYQFHMQEEITHLVMRLLYDYSDYKEAMEKLNEINDPDELDDVLKMPISKFESFKDYMAIKMLLERVGGRMLVPHVVREYIMGKGAPWVIEILHGMTHSIYMDVIVNNHLLEYPALLTFKWSDFQANADKTISTKTDNGITLKVMKFVNVLVPGDTKGENIILNNVLLEAYEEKQNIQKKKRKASFEGSFLKKGFLSKGIPDSGTSATPNARKDNMAMEMAIGSSLPDSEIDKEIVRFIPEDQRGLLQEILGKNDADSEEMRGFISDLLIYGKSDRLKDLQDKLDE